MKAIENVTMYPGIKINNNNKNTRKIWLQGKMSPGKNVSKSHHTVEKDIILICFYLYLLISLQIIPKDECIF